MPTIYVKSPDERTVISIRGSNPTLDDWMKAKGYLQIDKNEFRRIKAHINRGSSTRDLDAVEPKEVDYSTLAREIALKQQTLKVSTLQRQLRIGYPTASRVIEKLVDEGFLKKAPEPFGYEVCGE